MTKAIKKIFSRFRLFWEIDAIRKRIIFYRQFNQETAKFKNVVFKNDIPYVIAGPFTGMKYINETVWGPIVPKWLGSYEAEISTWIMQIIDKQPAVIVDIGAAEGYYAVGLALKCPEAKVYAFEVDSISRRQLRRLAKLNGVSDHLVLKGWFNPADSALYSNHRRTVAIVDIEGAEYELLDFERWPTLASWQFIVELHPWATSADPEAITRKWSKTHVVEYRTATRRAVHDYRSAIISAVDDGMLSGALGEYRREDQKWALLKPKL